MTKTKARKFMARQGDVLIASATAPTKTSPVSKEAGRVVLAHGEATGHAHAFSRTSKASLVVDETDRRFLLIGGGGATLKHEEHGAIAFAPGEYQVIRQKEYAPEAIRQVAD